MSSKKVSVKSALIVLMCFLFFEFIPSGVFSQNKRIKSKNTVLKPAQGIKKTLDNASPVNMDTLYSNFVAPPLEYKPRPLWFWNNTTVTSAGILDQMQKCRDNSGYGGFGILPFGANFSPKYLEESYFTLYGVALKKAKELGMKLRIYDEYGFPSGSAGASNGDGIPRFMNKFPDATIKRLDKVEQLITGPKSYSRQIPSGTLMSVVAMDTLTKQCVDLTKSVAGGTITWNVPAGNWRIMIFDCVKDGDPNLDYLDPDAADKFIGMVHQAYYDRFKEYFGNTIDGVFYDEPTMYRAAGRIWTPKFNEKFEALYGFSPTLYYPALWYDIGPNTQAARNFLFGFRTELYASGFMKRTQDWCDAHGGITATGHQDNEDMKNPVSISGDIMKCYKYQNIPGIDKISGGAERPAEKYYKLISSAANNWDKPLVMSETYGDMGNLSWDQLYSVAMEQYTKGINMLIPHAVWYNTGNVTFLPELSYRNSLYSAGLPDFTKFIGRLNVLLQNDGRHVADIGVLYPIASLQGSHYLDGPLGFYAGGVSMPEDNYSDLGEMLSTDICRDFTWIHPDILDERCTLAGNTMKLNNAVNFEDYKVIIVPGHKTIRLSNLEKIKQFYDNGGKVIFTGTLPTKSAEFGHDSDVTTIIAQLFPSVNKGVSVTASSQWAGGGYDAVNAADGSFTTRWNAADKSVGKQWVEIDFGRTLNFNKTITAEAFNRTTSYNIQYWNDNSWITCVTGTSIGTSRKDSFATVSASKVRLLINSITAESASIYEFEVHLNNGPNLVTADSLTLKHNLAGGSAVYMKTPKVESMRNALDSLMTPYDVKFENDTKVRYIHKVRDSLSIYYFANTTAASMNTYARLRGKMIPEMMDPRSGTITTPQYTYVTEGGEDITRIKITLPAYRSCFIISSAKALVSGTSNPAAKVDFDIYPNPTDKLLTIQFGSTLYKKVNIIDMSGRIIQSHVIQDQTQNMKIDVSNLKKGAYFVSLLGVNYSNGKMICK